MWCSSMGIPESFYTDRAGWAFDTPKAGGKVSETNLTQVGETLGLAWVSSTFPPTRRRHVADRSA